MKQPLKFTFFLSLCFSLASAFAGTKNPLPYFQQSPSDIKMFSTFLFTAHGDMADGNRVVFAPQYSNAVDGNDAIKITNPGENFGLSRDGRTLAVEARQPITAGDSLFYNMFNLVPQSYKLVIVPEFLYSREVSCILIDQYLHTRTAVSLSDTNRFVLQVTSDAQSRASNRLMIIFTSVNNPEGPVKFTDILATDHNSAVTVSWKVEQELSVDHYEIERSVDNVHFNNIFSMLPVFNSITGGNYEYTDLNFLNSANFYRVKSTSRNGNISYSDIAKISPQISKTSLNVYPNPVINNIVQVRIIEAALTTYRIQVTNYSGLVVYSKAVRSTTRSFNQSLVLDGSLSKGNYTLTVFGEDGSMLTQKLMIQ